ncbi:hypothetical protein BGK67_32745 [Streptomyces subrutilus]|uniref:Tetratricopeptide repeat protein n=1 Tax=Streptomyces subrutilus TaxID=36818 RepID=A0A1E5P0M9_9ACTN|nr:hypothetical protein BGK67_32745 [Streptomyces subrutilus]
MRARSILLAGIHPAPREQVDAYRVLAQVSPAAYLPLLVRALHRLSYDVGTGKKHAVFLALCEEAVAAARAIDPAEPFRADVLYVALDWCQKELYEQDRHTEGLALRAEMLAIGRAQAARSAAAEVRGLHAWAAGLSEAGRYAEAADALTEIAEAALPRGPRNGELARTLLDWAAALDDAGRSEEALAACEQVVAVEAAEAATDRVPMTCHLFALVRYAQMLDIRGRGTQAAAVRQEALALLTELAATGERTSWGGYPAQYWAVLLSFACAETDRPAPGGPRPATGAAPMPWSPDGRRRFLDSRTALREEVDALTPRAAEDPDRHLAELVRLHRALTVRSAVYWVQRTLFATRVRSLFDEGVALARRLSHHAPATGTPALATALIDRATFHTAAHEFAPALADFREALTHLGETTPPAR